MKQSLAKRLQQVERTIGSVPIPGRLVEAAFETFRKTGVLPDDQRLAYRVTQRARCGYAMQDTGNRVLDQQMNIRICVNTPPRTADPTMDALYDEAVFASGTVRTIARQLLIEYANDGWDVTEPLFAGTDFEKPTIGSVAMNLAGFPDMLIAPPYEDRARAFIDGWRTLHDALDELDSTWDDDIEAHARQFREHRVLPDDRLQRRAVLAFSELGALFRNALGENVATLMTAIDASRATEAS